MKHVMVVAGLILVSIAVKAQTIFVDQHGRLNATGTKEDPFPDLGTAVKAANLLPGQQPVNIKVSAGFYAMDKALTIKKEPENSDSNPYTIEAAVMPDDSDWLPSKMPVIQVFADSGREGRLPHASVAFNIQRSNVCIKGLKFLGNPNPSSLYYYAIERKDKQLTNLRVSQCYFIADKYSSPMQGGVFAQGMGIQVEHCIFYGCKNAVLVFSNIKGFSLSHSIIYGAYEAAVWFGYGEPFDLPFNFHDNIISNGNYVLVGEKGLHKNYIFTNNLFTGNRKYLAFNGDKLEDDMMNKPSEKNVFKNGVVQLVDVTAEGVPKNYLHLSPSSAGAGIDAGVLSKPVRSSE